MSKHQHILPEIESFLSETGMGESYFGKKAVGNSELVDRLRNGRRIWPDTEDRVRDFIQSQRQRDGDAA